MKRNERGITLIALIITVIILLVLAGTAISIAINGDSLFSKANDAKTSWNSKVSEEETTINQNLALLDQLIPRGLALPTGWNSSAVAMAYSDGTTDTRVAPIPKGFVASSATGENSIATGLVIYKGTDPVTDDNVATAQTSRDQYVWIPVDNSSTITWLGEASNPNPDTTVLDDGTGTVVDETKEPTTLTTDFNAMKESVQTYGGFYISRYELGGTADSNGATSVTSVKGQTVFNAGLYSSLTNPGGVNQWYGLYNAAHKNITDGANTVLSGHMIFGSEYEKVLAFIDSNNEETNGDPYSITAHNSKQQTVKHASGIIANGQTGKELDTVNNIVDLEGNVCEWTAKAYSTKYRVKHGGDNGFASDDFFYPVSDSDYERPTLKAEEYGARQALYVIL